MNFQKNNFELMFEAKGLKPLFQGLSLDNFMQPESVLFIRGEVGAYYISKISVSKMKEVGSKLYSSPILFLDDIDNCIRKAYSQNEKLKQSKDISLDDVKSSFSLLKEFEASFKYLDNGYLDGAYEVAKELKIARENVEKIEIYKNSSRVELNKIFFEKDGMWDNMLIKISTKFSISRDILDWYLEHEVYELFNDNKLPDINIADRKKAVVFYRDEKNGIMIDGQKAVNFLDNFFDGNKTESFPNQIIQGKVANKGDVVKAKVFVISTDYSNLDGLAKEMDKMDIGDVLVSQTTAPELMPALKKASAVVTDIGGMLSHAAIISRELNIPCVVATGNASKLLKTGDIVSIDTIRGVVTLINKI